MELHILLLLYSYANTLDFLSQIFTQVLSAFLDIDIGLLVNSYGRADGGEEYDEEIIFRDPDISGKAIDVIRVRFDV